MKRCRRAAPPRGRPRRGYDRIRRFRLGLMPDALHIEYLNALDVASLALTDDEILDAVEAGLLAQGRGETVIEPRVHLLPGKAFNGHFNVLRGYVAPLRLAGV